MTKVTAPLTIEGEQLQIVVKSRRSNDVYAYKVALVKTWPCTPFKYKTASAICYKRDIRREIIQLIKKQMSEEDEIEKQVEAALEEATEKFEEVERQ